MIAPFKRAGIIVGALSLLIAAVFGLAIVTPSASMAAEGTPHLLLTLKDGMVDIELLPALAPKAVERVIALADKGFYDGTPFHRVIDGFMAQGGDPTGTGMGGSDLPDLPAEFSTSEHFVRGVVAAARTNDPNSANSQFFIMFADAPWLDGQYTIWGKVVSGMEFVDSIKKGEGDSPVVDPDKIVSAKIEYRN